MDRRDSGEGLWLSGSLARQAGIVVLFVRRAEGLPILRSGGDLARVCGRAAASPDPGAVKLLELVHREDRRRLGRHLRELEGPRSHDFRWDADEPRWGRVHVGPWPDDGAPEVLALVVQDITRERQAGLRAMVCRSWIQTIARHAPVILFGVNAAGVFTKFEHYVSGGEIGTRYSVVGRPVSEVFEGLPEHVAALSRALAGERISERMQHRGENFEVHCEVIDYDDGLGTHIVGTIINVTRQVLIDQALASNQSYLETIIHTVTDGILLNGPDGRIKFANTRLATLLGVRPEDMLGKHIFDFMDKESADTARANLKRRRAGHSDRFDHRWRRADGTALWSVVTAKPMYDQNGEHLGSLVAVTDITERKRAEDALRRARDELEQRVADRTVALASANKRLREEVATRARAQEIAVQANRSKSAFLASMSHELRTPLNAIIGYNEMIIDEIRETGEGASHLADLKRVLGASRHLLSLINDVLDLSKIEAAKMEILVETFRLGEMLHELQATIMPLALKNDNTARVECEAPRLRITTDRTKIKQILLNLLGNACKFTREGEVVLRAAVIPRGGVDWLELEVADTGVGIARAQQEKIFHAFIQTDEGRAEHYGGTGLGLTISKRLCEMLGGEITVESELGAGTCFSVSIPLRRRRAVSEPVVRARTGRHRIAISERKA